MVVPAKQFFKSLYREIGDDNVFNGAAALAYYLFLALFPAMIFLLSILPFLPIENLHQEVMSFVRLSLPGETAEMLSGVIAEVTRDRRGGLVSIVGLLTLWAASAGTYAVMQHLNISYDVQESRPFWKARGLAILLTLMIGALIPIAFGLVIFGGLMQSWLEANLGLGAPLLFVFGFFRWIIIGLLLLSAFSLTYYFGPDVEQEFRFITPGAIFGTLVIAVASIVFRVYVENFGNYAVTYGSIGAIIVLMLWLYITGLVILVGSEINALVEHYSFEGKVKGERAEGVPASVTSGQRAPNRRPSPQPS